jgi:type III secretion system YscD/HrpQ family protein
MKIEPQLQSVLPQIELRVLYGPQSGSRLTLAPGDFLLGAGDDCAIMLAGPRIQDCHAKLAFDGKQPTITPVDGEVFDSQGNELTDTLPLTLGMPFELGGIWIAIDDPDAPWPDPEAIVAMAGLAPATPSASAPSPAPDATTRSAPALAEPPQKRRARFALMGALSLIISMAVAAITVSVWLVKQAEAPKPVVVKFGPGPEPQLTSQLRELLAKVAPGQMMTVTTRIDGTPKIEGYVSDTASAERVQRAIRKLSSTPAIALRVDSEIFESTRKVIARQNAPARAMLSVSEVRNGHVLLNGAVTTASVRDSVVDAIRAEVPGVREVTGNLYTAEDLSNVLLDRITSAGLMGKLQVLETQPEFVLRGRLNETEMGRWEKLLLDFSDSYGSLLPIRATVAVMQRKPPVNVQMIVGGEMPFVVTDNGQHIGRGGDANGHTLSAVRDNEVIFDGNERFRIPR